MGWFSFGSGGSGASSAAGSSSSFVDPSLSEASYAGAGGGGGGGMMSRMQPMLSQMGGRGGGGGGSTETSSNMGSAIRSTSMAADKIGTAVTAPKVQERQLILDLVPDLAHIGESVGPVATTQGGAAMARAAQAERSKMMDAYGRDQYSSLGRKIRTVNARGQVVHNAVGIAVEIAKLVAGGAGAYAGKGSGMAAGKSGMSGVGSYLGQEAATRNAGGGDSGGGGMGSMGSI